MHRDPEIAKKTGRRENFYYKCWYYKNWIPENRKISTLKIDPPKVRRMIMIFFYTENSISLRQRYRIINLSKTYERYMYRY